MNEIWANRLIAGTKTWAELPVVRQSGVKSILAARTEAGTITPEQYQAITGEEYIDAAE